MPTTPQNPAASEWLKVMVEEVERKRDEAARARREQDLRAAERGPGADAPKGAAGAPAGRGRSGRKTSR
ncbi:MAG: hypothetical protein MUC71_09010 [Steroidobacteraceae bacterium]|jgi:hypothetical protein|nr:hypothetical protein [Steroidobacteraceae bacterium]